MAYPGKIAIADQPDASAGVADIGDQFLVTRTVENHDYHDANVRDGLSRAKNSAVTIEALWRAT